MAQDRQAETIVRRATRYIRARLSRGLSLKALGPTESRIVFDFAAGWAALAAAVLFHLVFVSFPSVRPRLLAFPPRRFSGSQHGFRHLHVLAWRGDSNQARRVAGKHALRCGAGPSVRGALGYYLLVGDTDFRHRLCWRVSSWACPTAATRTLPISPATSAARCWSSEGRATSVRQRSNFC